MTDKKKIRAEIERRLNRENEILWNAKLRGTYASPSCEYNLLTLTSLRDFIDSLPEEPTIEAEIVKDLHNLLHVKTGPLPMPSKVKFGDKVKIIILPDEYNKTEADSE